ncbi:hypothetical protein ACA910_006650 [Epithemia clementina (nom. ined.)]
MCSCIIPFSWGRRRHQLLDRRCGKARPAFALWIILLLVKSWIQGSTIIAFSIISRKIPSSSCHHNQLRLPQRKRKHDLCLMLRRPNPILEAGGDSPPVKKAFKSRKSIEGIMATEQRVLSTDSSLHRLRRCQVIRGTLSMMVGLASGAAAVTDVAHAARGAAELDLEFYLRDLVGGNPPEGTTVPTSPATMVTSSVPRQPVDADFATWFQTTALVLLADQVRREPQLSSQPQTTTRDRSVSIPADRGSIQTRFDSYRTNPAILRAFSVRTGGASSNDKSANINNSDNQQSGGSNSSSDFDLTCYAIWRTATDSLPTNYRARDEYLRNFGRAILRYAQTQNVFSAIASALSCDSDSLVDKNEATIALLDWFKTRVHLCSDYRIVSDAAAAAAAAAAAPSNTDKTKQGRKSNTISSPTRQQDEANQDNNRITLFDELDDEALNDFGASVNPLVTIVDSATLGASLQLNGEGSRFAPDWLGPTLAALWEDVDGMVCRSNNINNRDDIRPKRRRRQVSWEAFFVDPVYRPNPKDYFPTEQLYQFTIMNKE